MPSKWDTGIEIEKQGSIKENGTKTKKKKKKQHEMSCEFCGVNNLIYGELFFLFAYHRIAFVIHGIGIGDNVLDATRFFGQYYSIFQLIDCCVILWFLLLCQLVLIQ